MRVMEITLKTSGLVTASNLLTRLANATDKYGLALRQIEQTTKGLSQLSTATDTATGKVGKLTQALKDAVTEQEKLGKGKINRRRARARILGVVLAVHASTSRQITARRR